MEISRSSFRCKRRITSRVVHLHQTWSSSAYSPGIFFIFFIYFSLHFQDSCELCVILYCCSQLLRLPHFDHNQFLAWLRSQLEFSFPQSEDSIAQLIVDIFSIAFSDIRLIEFLPESNVRASFLFPNLWKDRIRIIFSSFKDGRRNCICEESVI